MDDTIREQIIAAYTTRLSDILIANVFEDFNTNIGQTVFRAVKDLETENLPFCVLWPSVEEITSKYNKNVCTMVIRVEGLMEFGSINPSIIQEKILGDLIWAMTNPDTEVSDLVEDVQYTSGGPADFPNAEDSVTSSFIEFEIRYNTLTGNPYQQ